MGKIIVRALGAGERTQKQKNNLRQKDRRHFRKITSWEYLHNKEIHHDWKAEKPYCFVVSRDEHMRIEQKIYEKEIGKNEQNKRNFGFSEHNCSIRKRK